MDTRAFWDEELRDFPHGGPGAAVWVVRRDGAEPTGPLRILFAWAGGAAHDRQLAGRPPLGSLLRTMTSGREELVRRTDGGALWVEPVPVDGETRGCLGIWFAGDEPWREGIFLWGQRLAARLRSVLAELAPCPGAGAPGLPTLFPLPPRASERPAAFVAPTRGLGARTRVLPLPRPVEIPGIPGCVGCSEEMMRLGRQLGSVARSGVNVLLNGESGTGKEIVARALHLRSDRGDGPFVAQNCAALPETLFESELFGHRAGAFTGAAGEKKGLLSAASGGTFFLDEIGDMPLPLQIKLLRTMQERRVRRIGELVSRPVDIRFVAATHKDLRDEMAAGRFRLDLYYRLKVVHLEIPPLRHRPEDVAPLFAYFLRRCLPGRDDLRLTEEALGLLQRWSWPGNVRELENEVQRFAALHAEAGVLRPEHLSEEVRGGVEQRLEAKDLGCLRELDQAGELLEKYLIRKAIAATDGRKAAAARRLGLSRQGLYKKIARYGMRDLIESPLARDERG